MKQLVKTFVLFLLAVVPGIATYAQSDNSKLEVDYTKEGRGWVFGLNVGVYYPSKATAAYYNGKSSNKNNVDYVMSNHYWYQDIFHAACVQLPWFFRG